MLVESEGNIRITTLLPPAHIAIAGIEKVVPSRSDFQPFIELLPASATGQPLTSYVSILRPPLTAPSFAAFACETTRRPGIGCWPRGTGMS